MSNALISPLSLVVSHVLSFVIKLPTDLDLNSVIFSMLPLVFATLWMGVSSLGIPSADIPLDLVPVIVEAGPDTVSLISGKLSIDLVFNEIKIN